MMRRYWRMRRIGMAVVATGACFQLGSCGTDLSLFPLRVGFSSFTLPFNEYLIAFFGLINATIAQAVAAVAAS